MSAAELLDYLTRRGIALKVEASRLVYDAPHGVIQPADLAQLRAHKPDLLKVLTRPSDMPPGRRPLKPAAPLSGDTAHATTLTLSCDKTATRPVRAHTPLDTVLATACHGLSISAEELRRELEDDLDAIGSSELNAHGLRLVAETLSACLPHDADPSATETRHNAVIAMLHQHPAITHAFATNDETDPDYVILTVAIRGKATCDLRIPTAKFDGLTVLEIIEQQLEETEKWHLICD